MIKTKFSILLLVFSALIFSFTACDKVEPPYMNEDAGQNDEDTVVVRKILLEEFTGHQCPNCPEGMKTANQLKSVYGDRFLIMSIHTGLFARPTPGDFENDYRTEAGDGIAEFFGINQFPVGIINRTEFDGSTMMSPSAWGSAISQIIDVEPVLKIKMQSDYNSSTKILNISISTEALTDVEGWLFVSAFILEDGIISPQKTNDEDYPTGIIMDYEHNHVLRAAINGTWGEELSNDGMLTGEISTKDYSISISDDWEADNCKIIAFVYEQETMQIIQAEEKEI